MVTVARVRKGALELPEVEERTHFGAVAFYVGGKSVASLTKHQDQVRFSLPADQAEAVVAEHPGAEPIVRQGTTIGVGLPVATLDVRVLDRLLHQAWAARAPKRLVTAAAAAAAAAGETSAELPAVGRPATRALTLQGITTLAQVAEHTEAELLDLHGVGPKAIRILREALAAAGQDLRPS
jgi:hypothetical protein